MLGIFCAMLASFAALPSAFCYAENLPDPTRPPAGIFPPASGFGAGAGNRFGREAAETQPSGLHTIIISGTRRAAIIGGKTVELDGKYGNARLIEVNEDSVVLKEPNGRRRVLNLFPGVKMSSSRESANTNLQETELNGSPGSNNAEPIQHKETK